MISFLSDPSCYGNYFGTIIGIFTVFLSGCLFGFVLTKPHPGDYPYKLHLYLEKIWIIILKRIGCPRKSNDDQEILKIEHHAIINAYRYEYTRKSVEKSGTNYLKKALLKANVNFREYYCTDVSTFKEILKSPYCTHLWIFGHGIRHGIELQDRFFFYCEVEDVPPKKLIAQYHCNTGEGRSLADYCESVVVDVPEGMIRSVKLEETIKIQLKNLGIIG